MANDNQNIQSNTGDILGAQAAQQSSDPAMYKLLNNIERDLQALVKNGLASSSQGSGRDTIRDTFNESYAERSERHKPNRSRSNTDNETSNEPDDTFRGKLNFNNAFESFTDALEDSLVSQVTGSSFKSQISSALKEFADAAGISLSNLPKDLGKIAGRQLANAIKNTGLGRDLSDSLTALKSNLADSLSNALRTGASNINQARNRGQGFSSNIQDIVVNARSSGVNSESLSTAVRSGVNTSQAAEVSRTALTQGQSGLRNSAQLMSNTQALSKLGGVVTRLGPYAILIYAILKVLSVKFDRVKRSVDDTKQSLKKTREAYENAANMYQESFKTKINEFNKRVEADIRSMTEAPFNILKDSAKEVQEAWSSTMATITATQGYSKAELQDLMSIYSQRITAAGLSSVVSAADMTKNLSKVLESGLSGKVAEEFAYIATILNKAIPTEDFFSYASTYASIAANAIKVGQSQSEAIEYANNQLEQFASNLLYASREIAGGFSTGLRDASSLLEESVKIANSARSGDAAAISGVLTSVSAIVGAIAPDLSSALVSNIVSSATGGNSSNIAALRSLAGVGASNTEFLQALANDPQKVFTNLFASLANLQRMSNDNFMEVAEGLSEVFGVSMDAFARVDFAYLADNIKNMSVNNNALDENLTLLAKGHTTPTPAQLRIQEINKMILDEGLSYVLDNEVAQAVQEHMWEQELNQELKENTYGVELVGNTIELLGSIYTVIQTIVTLLNPLLWGQSIANAVSSAVDYATEVSEVDKIIKMGVVGRGNAIEYADLVDRTGTRKIVDRYIELLGSVSSVELGRGAHKILDTFSSVFFGGLLQDPTRIPEFIYNRISDSVDGVLSAAAKSAPLSRYTFRMASGKSSLALLSNRYNTADYEYQNISELSQSQSQITKRMTENINNYLADMNTLLRGQYKDETTGRTLSTYEDWAARATEFGIKDVKEALAAAGLSEQEAKNRFVTQQSVIGSEMIAEKDRLEKEFWANGNYFWLTTHPEFEQEMYDYQEAIIYRQDVQIAELKRSNATLEHFLDEWITYYVEHTAYTRETLSAYDVADIRNAEKSETGDAVLALANALTSNMVDLKDPEVQQNVLLAQILKVLEAIMQQNNVAATLSLPNTLSSLGLGATNSGRYNHLV